MGYAIGNLYLWLVASLLSALFACSIFGEGKHEEKVFKVAMAVLDLGCVE